MKFKRLFSDLGHSRYLCAALFLGCVVAAIVVCPQTSKAQQQPVPKLTLAQVEELVSHHVPDATMSLQIQRRGLAFAPNQAIIDSLRAKGAGPQTLAAIEASSPKQPAGAAVGAPLFNDLLYVPSFQGLGLIELSPGEGRTKRTAKTSLTNNSYVAWNPKLREFYVAASNGAEVAVISADTFTQVAAFKEDVGWNTYSMAVSPDGRTLYLTCGNGTATSYAGKLISFDTASRRHVATVAIPGPQAMHADFLALNPSGDRLYLSSSSTIAEYTAPGLQPLRQQSFAGWPQPLVASADGQFLFIMQQDKLLRISVRSLSVDKSLVLPEAAGRLSLSRDSRHMLASGRDAIYRVPLSLDSASPIHSPRPVGSGIAFTESSDGKAIYAFTGGNQQESLWVIDQGTGQVLKTIDGIAFPFSVIAVPEAQMRRQPKLTHAQLDQMLHTHAQDDLIASQIQSRGLNFSVDHKTLEAYAAKDLGPLTLAALHDQLPMGKVEIQTEPGSQLVIDGKEAGNAGTDGNISLQEVDEGNHEITAKKAGFQDAHLTFTLANKEDKQISLPLEWQGGFLTISTQPAGADITLSGPQPFKGVANEVKCPPGSYTATVSLDGYVSQTRTFQIATGEHHKESVQLKVDPAFASGRLADARAKLEGGNPSAAIEAARNVLKLSPGDANAMELIAEASFLNGDIPTFINFGNQAIEGGKTVSVPLMHVHNFPRRMIHPVTFTFSASGFALAVPPGINCKIPPSTAFNLVSRVEVMRDQTGAIELHISYLSKPPGSTVIGSQHDLDFVANGSSVVTQQNRQQGGTVVIGGMASIQSPQNAVQLLQGIVDLGIRIKK